ncbi:hypothetical protein BOTBODRAFT_35472 [Botryobasidium botryosum FD-172 SS1]|uniref:Uncharacterized protein n=1 Tax=Botryobasidium botryosum (strain FD-172 SS1) TaxID=930990 RepID=A0A067M783_BOTB1|nr:hypothetical protein BOTBODRAFT_35472 [Botryobasidium botryosum FD-172 SS1]
MKDGGNNDDNDQRIHSHIVGGLNLTRTPPTPDNDAAHSRSGMRLTIMGIVSSAPGSCAVRGLQSTVRVRLTVGYRRVGNELVARIREAVNKDQ